MEISCAFPSGPDVVDHIVEAERLGYERAWLYDSPALVRRHLDDRGARGRSARSASVSAPRCSSRTCVTRSTQASAIATLEQLAPGRAVVAIGTGFTGRMAMGQKPLTWAYTRRYIEQVRALLRGEKVEVDGALVQMLHATGLRVDVPDHDADRRRRERAEGLRGRATSSATA